MTVLNLSVLCTGRVARACTCSILLALSIFSTEGWNKKKPVVVLARQSNPDEIEVTPALASNMKRGTPETHEVTDLLQVSAHVETDASRIARVGSPVAGRILKLVVFEGQSVRLGTVLATLHSTDLSDAQLALVKAYSQKNLAETATKRAEQLVAADVIGRAELERRPDELASMTFTGHTVRKLTVPQTAVVREENRDYIFVEIAPNKILLREVVLGEETGDRRVLQSGIREDERIVLDGAFHLNNQRKQNAIKGGE